MWDLSFYGVELELNHFPICESILYPLKESLTMPNSVVRVYWEKNPSPALTKIVPKQYINKEIFIL